MCTWHPLLSWFGISYAKDLKKVTYFHLFNGTNCQPVQYRSNYLSQILCIFPQVATATHRHLFTWFPNLTACRKGNKQTKMAWQNLRIKNVSIQMSGTWIRWLLASLEKLWYKFKNLNFPRNLSKMHMYFINRKMKVHIWFHVKTFFSKKSLQFYIFFVQYLHRCELYIWWGNDMSMSLKMKIFTCSIDMFEAILICVRNFCPIRRHSKNLY